MARGDGTKTQTILRELQKDATRTAGTIAKIAGCAPGTVRTVAAQNGFTVGRGPGRDRMEPANRDFVASEASRLNVTFTEMLNAIITDARLDADG